MTRPWKNISDVTDASNRTGIKRYWFKLDAGVTEADILTAGFINRYDLRGWQSGDLIAMISDTRHLLYEIVGDDNADRYVELVQVPAVYGSDDQIAAEVPIVSPLVGPAIAATEVQAAIDALSAYLDALDAGQVDATAGAAGTPTVGATDVQAQLDALNAYVDGLQAGQVGATDPGVGPAAGITDVGAYLAALNAGLAAVTDDQTAAEVTTTAPVAGPALGQTSAQAYLDALNAYLIALASTNVSNTGGLAGTPTAGTVTVQAAIDALNTVASANATMSGRPLASVDMGTFTGSTIPDNVTMVAALQALETAVEAAAAGTGPTFAATNTDTLVAITAAGTAGHTPGINLNTANLITTLLASPAFVAGINAIISARFTFDGTTLCFDFNDNGNTMA